MKKHALVLTMILGFLLVWSMPVFSADTAGETQVKDESTEPYTLEKLNSLDTNKDGVLDKNELKADPKMHEYYGDKKTFQHADRNNDGVISMDEAKDQREWDIKNTKDKKKEKIDDKKELKSDKKELKGDIKELKDDKKELREDIKAGAGKDEIKQDLKEIKDDKKSIRQDRQEIKRDKNDRMKEPHRQPQHRPGRSK